MCNTARVARKDNAVPVTSPPLPVPRPGPRAAGSPPSPAALFSGLSRSASAPSRIAASGGHRRRRRRGSSRRAFSSSVRMTRAGAPTISELSGNVLPSVTTAPAPTRRVVADPGAVEQIAPMPIRLFVADRAAVQHDVVADHAIGADGQRKAGIGVQRGIVLDLRALAELDPLVVAAQHRAEPDAGIAP